MELQDVSIEASGTAASGSAVISASKAPYTRSSGDGDGSMALSGSGNGRYGADPTAMRVKVLLAVLACGALVCWVIALVLLAGKPLATFPVEKSENDSREYRVVFLENGLEVLLVSDPETKVSSAAVDVKVSRAASEGGLALHAVLCLGDLPLSPLVTPLACRSLVVAGGQLG